MRPPVICSGWSGRAVFTPTLWNTFSNIVAYTGPPTPTNGLFTFFDDGSQFPFGPMRFYRVILLQSLTNGVPGDGLCFGRRH